MPDEDEIIKEEDGVVVVVESDNTIKEPEKKEPEPKPDAKDDEINNLKNSISKLEKSVSYAAGSYRIIENLKNQVADLVKKQASTPKEETLAKTDVELAELLNTDIVAGVAELYRRERLTEKQKEKKDKEFETLQKEQSKQIEIMEKNKQSVLDKYPELTDPTSEYTKIWLEVIEKHPEHKTNYLGPITTMKIMEDECRRQGLKVKDTGVDAEEIIEKEVNRRTRVKQTNLKPGAKTKPGGGEIVLTQDQIAFARHNNIPLKTYAVTLKRLGSGEKKVEA